MSRCTIVTLLLVSSCLVILSSARDPYFSARCSTDTAFHTTLTPSKDGVPGRYIVEWCSDANRADITWNLEIEFNPKGCNGSFRSRQKHSITTVHLKDEDIPNCSNVCLSKVIDLMFSSCYIINNWLPFRGSIKSMSRHIVSNPYTVDYFDKEDTKGYTIDHGDYVTAHFKTSNIPVTSYKVEMTLVNTTNHHESDLKDITANCSRLPYEVACRVQRGVGQYHLGLYHLAPWASSDFVHNKKNQYIELDMAAPTSPPEPVDSKTGTGSSLVWASACLGALCAGALLLLLALRCRRARHERKLLLSHWLHRVGNKPVVPEVKPVTGPVLLLYARECAAAEPVVEALKALLERVAPGQVYDLYSPSTLALAASEGGAWVRGFLHSAGARCVLLQTPALQALHAPRLAAQPSGMQMEEPLLSRHAVYRQPLPADWLLQFALRLLQAPAPTEPPPYRKYYLATLQGLETDALPYTVPFRRYVLPRHAHTLVQDLSPPNADVNAHANALQHALENAAGTPSVHDKPSVQGDIPNVPGDTPSVGLQHDVDVLAHSIVGFVDYARANPDYLMSELLIL